MRRNIQYVVRGVLAAAALFSTTGLAQAPISGEMPKIDRPVRVSGEVIAAMVISKPAPVYPPTASGRHAQGTVVLHAFIGKDGHIQDLQVVSSPDPDLATAAVDAVSQWTYRPYMLNGSPVSVETAIKVNFTFAKR